MHVTFVVSFGAFLLWCFLPTSHYISCQASFFFSENLNHWWPHCFLQQEQRYTKVRFAWLSGIFRGWPPLRVCALPGWCLLQHGNTEHWVQAGPVAFLQYCNDNFKQYLSTSKGSKFFWQILANFLDLAVLRHRIMVPVKVSQILALMESSLECFSLETEKVKA